MNIVADWRFDYNLSDKIPFLDEVIDYPTIIFKKTDKHIIGFYLIVKNSLQEDAENKAAKKAKNLKCILTIKSGMPIEVNLREYHSLPKEGQTGCVSASFTSRYKIEGSFKNLDLNMPLIQTIINSTQTKSLKYKYATKGIFHYYNGNPIECIKELFKIVEKKNEKKEKKLPPDYKKYKVLRNMYSHKLPYLKKTRNLFLEVFNQESFDYMKYDPDGCWIIINLESNKNQRILNKLANDFIEWIRNDFGLVRF